jgi:hypothetical protein
MTTTIPTVDRQDGLQELPELTAADRVALAIGARLILRAEQHGARRAERTARTEQARTARAEASAAGAARDTFEHRAWAGPTW